MSETARTTPPFVFFGSPDFAADVLAVLTEAGCQPELIVTAPDRPRGRGQEVTPSAVGVWADEHSIPQLKPETVDTDFLAELEAAAPAGGWPLFVVVAYGHILPAELIYHPEYNTLNLHPSLLPKLRGPSPIRSAILEEDETGITIIELDEKMDHGPIVAQQKVAVDEWPPRYFTLADRLAQAGGKLLAETIPAWTAGEITVTPQDHAAATYSRKFSSEDGLIDLDADPEENLRKIRAFTDWPKAHFYTETNQRVLITKAHLTNGELIIDEVKPAGGAAVDYETFQQQQKN